MNQDSIWKIDTNEKEYTKRTVSALWRSQKINSLYHTGWILTSQSSLYLLKFLKHFMMTLLRKSTVRMAHHSTVHNSKNV